ncbi:hypothetical protein OHB54_46215 [Streptomyces sp. NBC_01007]|nr:hypothetical protein OHB54_00035 [Streptomyces sp. NBC_01007]WRZ95750.1 hypothetical protein OHB54_46215 [Streptomyces sp. NBC_01007]
MRQRQPGPPRAAHVIVTGPQERRWTIGAATSNQIVPSRPASLWQAVCTDPFDRSPVLSARAVAAHIRGFPT